jgi:hypothetical protein
MEVEVELKNFWNMHNVIFIIDEAQGSYSDKNFWVECTVQVVGLHP